MCRRCFHLFLALSKKLKREKYSNISKGLSLKVTPSILNIEKTNFGGVSILNHYWHHKTMRYHPCVCVISLTSSSRMTRWSRTHTKKPIHLSMLPRAKAVTIQSSRFSSSLRNALLDHIGKVLMPTIILCQFRMECCT